MREEGLLIEPGPDLKENHLEQEVGEDLPAEAVLAKAGIEVDVVASIDEKIRVEY